MKYVSLFAGIGGFDYALNKLGMHCVYANEWDKYATQIYRKNFSSRWYYDKNGIYSANECELLDTRDIRTVTTEEIPDHDLLVGGFPCQAFSIAGKRRGFDDTRGTLFFEIARILKDKQPKYFIFENVKGLLSHSNGDTFKTIISTLDELGYDLQWQVLNSKNFGVPQNRERVFIIGNLRGERRPEVFPVGSPDEIHSQSDEITKEVHNTASTLTARQFSSWNGNYLREVTKNMSQGYRVYDTQGISSTLAGEAGGVGAKTGLYAMRWQRTEKGKEARRRSQQKGRDYTPFSNGHRELVPVEGKAAGALTSQAIAKDSLIGNEYRIRRLTPLECERLQGFPDGWTEGISDTQRYKCLGNAVTVNVVEYIASKLLSSLGEK